VHIPPGEALRTGGVGVDRIAGHYARVAVEVMFGLGWRGGKCLHLSEAEGGRWDSRVPPRHHLWWRPPLAGKSI